MGAKVDHLTYDEYQALARRTAKPLEREEGIDHAILGLISDWGEMVTNVKAVVIYGKDHAQGSDLWKASVKELGDCSWFACHLCDHMGWAFDSLRPTEELPVLVGQRDAKMWSKHGAYHIGCLSALTIANDRYDDLVDSQMFGHVREFIRAWRRMCIFVGVEPEIVFSVNISKLAMRYPGKYSDADALLRRDEPK